MNKLKELLSLEETKEKLKLLGFIVKSHGSNKLIVSTAIYDGGVQESFNFEYEHNRKLTDIPSNILEVVDKICSEYLDSSSCLEYVWDSNYSSVEIIFDFTDRKIYLDGTYNTMEVDNHQIDRKIDEGDEKELYDEMVRLASEGYGTIEVEFSGYGDSGSISDEGYSEEMGSVSIGVFEDYLYGMLSNFGGWEINEGSQGTFKIDTRTKEITLYFGYNNEVSNNLYCEERLDF